MLSFETARYHFISLEAKQKGASWRDTSRQWKAFTTFRNLWDGYDRKAKSSIIRLLSERFGQGDRLLRAWRPMGQVKDFSAPEAMMTLSEESIYNLGRARGESSITSNRGVSTTLEEAVVTMALALQKTLPYNPNFSGAEFEVAFSMMIFRTAMGAMMEVEAIRALDTLCQESMQGARVVPAPASMESKDVDALVVDPRGVTLLQVSIKNLGALSPRTVSAYRSKGKTAPDLYSGFPAPGEPLCFLYPPGSSAASVRAKRMRLMAGSDV